MSSPDVSLIGLYRYDGLDRLASIAPAGQEVVRRFYRNSRLTTSIQGTSHHSVVQTEGLLLALRRVESDQVLFDLLATDQANSVLHSLDAMRNQAFVYSPYGLRSLQTSALSVPGFTGQTIDPITGYYLLGNGLRAFNPTLMRFNSPDTLSPFGEGGLNSYAYCGGDPVNYIDPTGQLPKFVLTILVNRGGTLLRRANEQFDDGFWQTIHKGLVPKITSPKPLEGYRKQLDDALETFNGSQSPFIKNLRQVNRNFASHGDTRLSADQARHYAELARQVDSGVKSDTTAFMQAAMSWGRHIPKQGGIAAVVGILFNSGGMLISGALQKTTYKTGKVLTEPRNLAAGIRSGSAPGTP
ncbi:RHS repeat-associated core domain-containing protein [Pseudomonas sp. RGM 3321]|uniref:RHS repeat-associated core domain-containing protein n=1 Tax=Pseudomonas sp. RGM 3321 TaxID=2930089 RepID=UPI001FCC6C8A|nr:RHS repeat-associated core domain-containing protein [Pseudomonas sp. RGM 3321]MCJ2369932.1 RHS repeat-associated core domain-containing protein [Pseudomonas sp. RGM 3321]